MSGMETRSVKLVIRTGRFKLQFRQLLGILMAKNGWLADGFTTSLLLK